MRGEKFKDFVGIGLLVVPLVFLAPLVDNYHYDYLLKKGIYEKDMLYKVLGDIRKIVSHYSYVRADIYYHGGVYEKEQKECDHAVHTLGHPPGEREHGEHRQKKAHGEERKEALRVSKLNVLPYLGEEIHIGKHVHLHGDEEKELLPWFYFAVRLDPKNVDAYVIGGFWIAKRLNRPDEAIEFLEEGLANNPDSWKIYTELGRIYTLSKKDYDRALTYFMKAYGLLNDDNSDKYDKREIFSLMAYCCEALGQFEKAAEFYRKVLFLFPHDKSISEKITILSSGAQ